MPTIKKMAMKRVIQRLVICSAAILAALCATGYKAETADKVSSQTDLVANVPQSSGTVGVRVQTFSPYTGTHNCFPKSEGWDRSYTTQYFRGPLASGRPNPFPNHENVPKVTINTLHASNGTQLATGIVIFKEGDPHTKVCATNAGAFVSPRNPNLSKVTFASTEARARYHVTILYKSETAANLNSIFFNWGYP